MQNRVLWCTREILYKLDLLDECEIPCFEASLKFCSVLCNSNLNLDRQNARIQAGFVKRNPSRVLDNSVRQNAYVLNRKVEYGPSLNSSSGFTTRLILHPLFWAGVTRSASDYPGFDYLHLVLPLHNNIARVASLQGPIICYYFYDKQRTSSSHTSQRSRRWQPLVAVGAVQYSTSFVHSILATQRKQPRTLRLQDHREDERAVLRLAFAHAGLSSRMHESTDPHFIRTCAPARCSVRHLLRAGDFDGREERAVVRDPE